MYVPFGCPSASRTMLCNSSYAGITPSLNRCITKRWFLRVAWLSDWSFPGRSLCSCVCRRSPVWCHLTGLYTYIYIYTYYTVKQAPPPPTRDVVVSRAVTFRNSIPQYIASQLLRISSHNERDLIYFVFRRFVRELLCAT